MVLGLAVETVWRLKRKTWERSRAGCVRCLRFPRSFLLRCWPFRPARDFFQPWKRYKRQYARFAQTRPDTKHLLADYQPGIEQIWIPEMNVVDRCTTCHQGMTQPSLADASVPQPFRAHPPIPHRVKEWGCVVCHRGQGPATEAAEAHETTLAWEQPLLPTRYIQASCGVCHQADLAQTPRLTKGRQMLAEFNCEGCHRLSGVETPAMIGPDLTNVGTKVSREWVYKWLKEPRTIVDDSGNTTVNGYETEDEPKMPYFRLSEPELRGLSAYLVSLRPQPAKPYGFSPKVVAAWEKKPDLADQGEIRFREMFCSTCHSLSVTRAGETKLIGGDIGPELTKVGSKVNPDWLTAWLRNPQAYLPNSKMPRYEWSDEDLYKVSHYIAAKLTDSDLLTNVPKLDAPTQEEIQLGRRLFVEKGCRSCHVIQGLTAQKDFGPDLSRLGGKNVSQLEFGKSKIPRDSDRVYSGEGHRPTFREFRCAHAAIPFQAGRSRCDHNCVAEHDGPGAKPGAGATGSSRRTQGIPPGGGVRGSLRAVQMLRLPSLQWIRRRSGARFDLRGKPGTAAVADQLPEKPGDVAA